MEAIVLAGGFGTRLSHVISDVPKPMAPIGDTPFLKFILSDLVKQGVKRIILAVGYKSEVIKNYFGSRFSEGEFSSQIIYSDEDIPLGTGGAIKRALQKCQENCALIINGDTFFRVNIREMFKIYNNNDCGMVMAIKAMKDCSRYGTVEVNNGKIVKFKEKIIGESGLINGGIYVLGKDVFKEIERDKFSFEQEVLEKIVDSGKIYAFESQGYFIDIGIPEDYYKACEVFLK